MKTKIRDEIIEEKHSYLKINLQREKCLICGKSEDRMSMAPDSMFIAFCQEHSPVDSMEFTNPKNYLLDREGNKILEILYNSKISGKYEGNFYSAIIIMDEYGNKKFFCTYDDPILLDEVQNGDGDLL